MFNLVKSDKKFELTNRTEEYTAMAKVIQENLPMVKDACANFGKSQSQFMDNFLTVSHPTPLRNARQILAEVNKSIDALREAQYNTQKKQLEIRRLERSLITETDDLKQEELELEIAFKASQIDTSMLYVEGAIRQITNYIEQYKLILQTSGYETMTEEDFEREEESYHIMKAFEQAICAARAHGGVIDEGNHIYFSQIGVNGQMAQNFINKLFEQEKQVLATGAILTHEFQTAFLQDMATFFKGCSSIVATKKGMTSLTPTALLETRVEELKKFSTNK